MNIRRILPLDKQSDNSTPKYLPETSFISLLVGSRGQGKSTLLINLLTNPNLLNNKFNEVFLISPTSQLDSKFNILKTTNVKVLNKPLLKLLKENNINEDIFGDGNEAEIDYELKMSDENFISKPSISFLEDLIKEQKFIIKKYGKKNANKILLIYDDCICNKIFKNEVFRGMIFNTRHLNISVILSSQSYFEVPKPIRLNAGLIILYYTANKKELENIYAENTNGMKFADFLKIYNDITNNVKTPFGFLVFNYYNKKEHRIQRCFEEFVKI